MANGKNGVSLPPRIRNGNIHDLKKEPKDKPSYEKICLMKSMKSIDVALSVTILQAPSLFAYVWVHGSSGRISKFPHETPR